MPQNKYSVPLSKIIKEMAFECVYLPRPAEDIMISALALLELVSGKFRLICIIAAPFSG